MAVESSVPDTERITTIDELKAHIGEEIRVSDWQTLTQDEVDAFGEISGDKSWIHCDPERARDSIFGGTIAQGNLILSMAPGMLERGSGIEVALQVRYGLNYGFDRVRFPSPIRVGQRMRARLTLVDVSDVSPDVHQIRWRRTVDAEGVDKPAMVAEYLSRQYV